MKNLIYSVLIGLTLLFSFDVNARPLFTANIFTSDMQTKVGGIFGMQFGQSVITRFELNLTPSLGGAGISLGSKIGPFEAFAGVTTITEFDDDFGRNVNVAGVMVFDPTGNPDGSGTFVELRYKQVFLRYTDYSVDYEWVAARTILVNGVPQIVLASNTQKVDGSAWWLGLAYSFN